MGPKELGVGRQGVRNLLVKGGPGGFSWRWVQAVPEGPPRPPPL